MRRADTIRDDEGRTWEWVMLAGAYVEHLVHTNANGIATLRCGVKTPGKHRLSHKFATLVRCSLCATHFDEMRT